MGYWRGKSVLLCATLSVFAAPAAAIDEANDPIESCRANSKTDKAHIACLKAALSRALNVPLAQNEPARNSGVIAQSNTAIDNSQNAVQEAAEPTGLGAERVKLRTAKAENQKDEPEEIKAAIVRADRSRSGTYTFHLDNGQVWRQKSSDAARVRLSKKRTYTVTIQKGLLSGYRLKIDGVKRRMLVDRLQ